MTKHWPWLCSQALPAIPWHASCTHCEVVTLHDCLYTQHLINHKQQGHTGNADGHSRESGKCGSKEKVLKVESLHPHHEAA